VLQNGASAIDFIIRSTEKERSRVVLNIKKIVLPVDVPYASLSVIHQAVTLAQHFDSEVVMLHVTGASKPARGDSREKRGLTGGNLFKEIVHGAEKRMDHSLGPTLESLRIRCVVGEGDTAAAILQVAEKEEADLIMMASQGETFYQFLLSSVTMKVKRSSECPIWTGASAEDSAGGEFAIRNVLCAVDLGPRSPKVVSWGKQLAEAFGARLTLAHVTAGVEFWGPGGSYVNQEWREALVKDATRRVAELQQKLGTTSEVFIGSGNGPKVLSEAAKQAKAEVLVTGCQPYGGHLRTHGFTIICAMPIPVLNV
jgi:nucleotide-binding universal stress UspA family protein